jgi:uncharacterized protein
MNHHYYLKLLGIGLSIAILGCAASPSSSSSPNTTSAQPQVEQPASPTPSSSEPGQFLPITAQADIGGQIIQLEVAQTTQQQAMGLMYRPALPDDRGMLFPFNAARSVQFWMRNVPVSLDMVFLLDGEVKAIASNVPPCTTPICPVYGPSTPVNQVIELRAGRAEELSLEVGDRVNIEVLEP